MSRLALAAVVALGALGLVGCTSGGTASQAPTAFDPVDPAAEVTGPITIGYQDIGSSQVMAEVYAKLLEEAGFDVRLTLPAQQADFVAAMVGGVVDIMPAYSGVFANAFYKDRRVGDPPVWNDVRDAQAFVNDAAAASGIEMLDPSPGNEGAVFAVSKDFSEASGITTLSQMAEWSRTHPLRFGAEETCETRPYCKPNLEKTYGMQIKEFVALPTDGTIVKSALMDGGADLGWLSGSDPTVDSPDLVALEQDKPLNIYRNIAPVVRRGIATPEVVNILNSATAKVTKEQLDAMVDAMTVDDEPAARVAAEFIAAQGLGDGFYTGPTDVVGVVIPSPPPAARPTTPPAGGPLRISYAPDADTEIAAHVYATALERAGIDFTFGDSQDSEDILEAMSAGQVQFSPMRLHSIANILNTQTNGVLATPVEDRSVDRMTSTTRDLATPRGITILGASSANVGSAWTVSNEFVHNTGITTLSELARVSQQRPIILGGPPICPERTWCKPFLDDRYEVKVGQFVPLDWGGGLTRAAIDLGEIDVGWLDGNDGGIAEFGFRALIDDLGRESVNPITPVLNTASVTPEISKVLDSVSEVFTTDDLQDMNYAVQFERRDIQDVVDEFLKAHNLD